MLQDAQDDPDANCSIFGFTAGSHSVVAACTAEVCANDLGVRTSPSEQILVLVLRTKTKTRTSRDTSTSFK